MDASKSLLRWSVRPLAMLLLAGLPIWQVAGAEEYSSGHDQAALVKSLPTSKHTLIEGIRQATKSGEAAISAKFEFDDAGKLSLSIYTAEKGLAVDPEHNVLKEFSGSPKQGTWNPEVEIFKDGPHIARSSQQLTLMALSPFTLTDILSKAEKRHHGKVFSITPVVRGHKPLFVVLETTKGKVLELDYNLIDGRLARMAR